MLQRYCSLVEPGPVRTKKRKPSTRGVSFVVDLTEDGACGNSEEEKNSKRNRLLVDNSDVVNTGGSLIVFPIHLPAASLATTADVAQAIANAAFQAPNSPAGFINMPQTLQQIQVQLQALSCPRYDSGS